MNRLTRYFQQRDDEEPPLGDFHVVRGVYGTFYVTREAAAQVERVLDRRWTPGWVVFRDLAGSRIRIRTRDVRGIYQCTRAQRAADRRLERAREREEEADRDPWEDGS